MQLNGTSAKPQLQTVAFQSHAFSSIISGLWLGDPFSTHSLTLSIFCLKLSDAIQKAAAVFVLPCAMLSLSVVAASLIW